jgi:galactokinase
MTVVTASSLRGQFQETFGKAPRIFSAPGRVNLIGEHTDYNDGFVLPIAIDRRTYVAAAPNDNARLRVHALDLNDRGEASLHDGNPQSSKQWLSYAAGVAWILAGRGQSVNGADLLISSNVPIGGGLSSSAAVEVATGKAIVTLSGIDVTRLELALAAHEAENRFTGARVGVMDQIAVTFGRRRRALLLDCRSLEVRYIPTEKIESAAAIVICNTNIKHELASSAYNQRRKECEMAVAILQKRMPAITSLRDVSVTDFLNFANELPEPVRRRARHVVTENQRTLDAADAVRRGDFEELGRLMKLSHESLRDDYEVTCPELNIMVELAWSHPGTFAARMTGGGFGGCSVNLVRRDQFSDFSAFIKKRYRQATGRVADLFVVEPADGAREENGQESDV